MNHRTQNVSFKTQKKPVIKSKLQSAPLIRNTQKSDKPVTNKIKTPCNSQLNTINSTPTPYIFRLSGTNKNITTTNAKSPPFYLLLDHIIAVLWHIFTSEDNKTKLGIGQLQWALYFLKGIIDPVNQERSLDVVIAIQTIEDCLLDCYANLANVITNSNSVQEISSAINLPQNIKPDINESLEQTDENNKIESYIKREIINLRKLAAKLILSEEQSAAESST